jgi:shikimate dehydrogenase
VIPFLAELTPVARAVGAVNTIIVQADGLLLGDNTDGAGFMADLRAQMADGRWQIADSKWQIETALVIGAGGAARSVVYALAEAGASVAVVNRTFERAQELCQTIVAALPDAVGRLSAHPFPAGLPGLAAEADLIVNTTSLGLHAGDPLPWDASVAFRPGQIVYDLIYNRPTELLALARSQSATALDGLGMLVHQGARAFELWTGREAPLSVMMDALRDA